MAPNLALISIPAYYVLAMVPHAYALRVATQGEFGKHENQNPRGASTIEGLRQKLSPEDFAKYERSEAAHKNNVENLPLYVAAVFAGLLAEQATKGTVGKTYVSSSIPTGLTRFIYSWFAIRILHNVAYITTTTKQWSHLRSVAWMIGTGLAFQQIWQAATTLGS